jgi:hypothetical protein
MRYATTFLAALALLVLAPPAPAAAGDAAAPAAAPPSGVVTVPARLDLGTVAPGVVRTERVWLVNASLNPVTVESIEPTCGCTTAPGFAGVTLEPATATPVVLSIRTPKAAGADKSVTVRFPAAWGAPATLEVTMETAPASADAEEAGGPETAPPAVLVPDRDHLGPVAAGAATDAVAWIINPEDVPLRVDAVRAGCGCTTVVGFGGATLPPRGAVPVRLRVVPKPTEQGEKRVRLTAVLGDGTRVESALAMTVTGALDAARAASSR